MVGRNRESGFVLLEVVIAGIVFLVLMSWAFTGGSSQLRHVGESFDQTRATRLASGRLEALRSVEVPIETGVTAFEIPADMAGTLVDLHTEQHVRRLEPGLFEVRVRVSWRPHELGRGRQVVLTTLIEREADR